MGGSLPKLGRVDPNRPEVSRDERGGTPAPSPKRTQSFGELDLDAMGLPPERPKPYQPADNGPPSSRARPSRSPLPAPTKPPPSRPLPPPTSPPPSRPFRVDKRPEGATRIAAGALDDALAMTRPITAPPPSGSSSRSVPSESGVASRDSRVAAIRELYAQGKAEDALAIAVSISQAMEDPYGGLIPIDEGEEPISERPLKGPSLDEPFDFLRDPRRVPEPSGEFDAADHTAIAPAATDSVPLALLTSQDKIPRLCVAMRDLSSLPIDPRAAFILTHVDGVQTMEEILDICAMPESEAIELIDRLLKLKVIAFD